MSCYKMQYSGVEGASHVLPGVCTALASFFKKDFEKKCKSECTSNYLLRQIVILSACLYFAFV